MIGRKTTRNVSRAAVCIFGSGMMVLTGCGGGSGGSAPLIATSTSLTASPANVVSGAIVTLAAAVEYAPAETASGTVDFVDGSATIGSSSLDPEGVGSLKISSLAVGSHSLTAVYPGNSTTAASRSSAVTVTVKAKGAAGTRQSLPVQVAISNVPEAETLVDPFSFAIAANPKTMGCSQPSAVVVERGENGNWRLYCPSADSTAAEKPQGYEVAVPGKYRLLAVAPQPWFLDTSGQLYLLLYSTRHSGEPTEPTP